MNNDLKIVFILATPSNTNNIKRIEAFIEAGYKVDVYAFSRGEIINKSDLFDIKILAEFSNDLPYWRRIKVMCRGIKRVLKETAGKNCIYYLIRNDVALIYSLLCRRPYIFEEADMTHTNFKNKLLANLTEIMIKKIIKQSVISVFRSEGFVRYHFKNKVPDHAIVIPNKLSPHIKDFPIIEKKTLDINHIRFGFVGVMRLKATFIFAETVLQNFPQHEFHFYGECSTEQDTQLYNKLKNYKNCFFHGRFKNPKDLTAIYCNIDILLSTYEPACVSARYLDSNKLYEAIYFETPIIVSANTFLEEKVTALNIGYAINALNQDAIQSFVKDLTLDSLHEKLNYLKHIEKDSCISVGYMNEFNRRIINN